MSQRKDDWDLCWYELSGTGCKSHNCRWRHIRSARKLYSSPYQKKRVKVDCRRGDSLRKPGAPIYNVMQHQDGRTKDKYGLVDYPEIDDEYGVKLMMQLMRKRGNRYGSKITSQVRSDSEVDMVNNMMVGCINSGKIQKLFQNSLLGENQTPKHQKMKSYTENSTTSVLSPLAKVFVPQFLMKETNSERIDVLKRSTNESHSTAETWLPGAVE